MERFEVSDSSSSYSGSDDDDDDDNSDSSESSESKMHKVNKRKRSDSGSDTVSEGSTNCVKVTPGLALSQLFLMDDGGGEKDESCYAQSGKNPSRVREVLKQPCCKNNCKRKLPFKLLMHMITIFWSMPKASQDCVLWSMQQGGVDFKYSNDDTESESSSSSSRQQTSWSIEGLMFPFHLFCCMFPLN